LVARSVGKRPFVPLALIRHNAGSNHIVGDIIDSVAELVVTGIQI
jgi:hypothetical protein